MPDTLQVVFGNYGEMTVDAATGNVVSYERGGDCGDEYGNDDPSEPGYNDITRVYIPEVLRDGRDTDILFCGTWSAGGFFEAPIWRPELDANGNVSDMTEEQRAAVTLAQMAEA